MVVHMRHTSGHTRNRRSHHALKVARFETCKDCNHKHLMHRVCGNCGKYRGRIVVDVLKKTMKQSQKGEAKNPTKNAEAKPKKEKAEKKAEPKEKKAKK
jgi:large subunit ribosomal protein L32